MEGEEPAIRRTLARLTARRRALLWSPPIMLRYLRASIALATLVLTGCPAVPPPASPMPSADAAIDRMRGSSKCGNGIQATAKLTHYGDTGRHHGELMMLAVEPARVRVDAISPFGVTLATLTNDDKNFALTDLKDKAFYFGPSAPCNIARLTGLPIPAPVLVDLLRGQAPVLKRVPGRSRIEWSGKGYYIVTIESVNDAKETIFVTPHPDDFQKPWSAQRMRVLEVEIEQQGIVLYHAEFDDHAPANTAAPRVDPDGIEPPVPPSGPACDAEIPRKLFVEVPPQGEEIELRFSQIVWNPPLIDGVFTQTQPGGTRRVPVMCSGR